MDELTAEEVLAMPLLEIPVLFHFVSHNYSGTGGSFALNFTCDPNHPHVAVDGRLYAPEAVYQIMQTMNNRMADQLNEDPLGSVQQDLTYSDSRIRYYLKNGPDWTTLRTNPDCSSFYFYTTSPSTSTLPQDAINIIYLDNGAPVNGGAAFGTNIVRIYNYSRSFYNGGGSTSGAGKVTNHEVGHLFDLDHTWHCQNICRKSQTYPNNPLDPEEHCCNQCFNTNGLTPSANPQCASSACATTFLMGGPSYLTLTLCEHRSWWSNTKDTPFEFSNYCNDSSKVEVLIYDTGTKLEWSGTRYVNADIIIKNGTEVEITCDLFMGADNKIVVERGARLIVRNGNISGLCDYKWQGIIVEGISDSVILAGLNYDGQLDEYDNPLDPDKAGTVVLLNSSISGAKTGISTYNSQYVWPDMTGYFGGLIYCENANFYNCNRAVEFMRYGQGVVKDKSKFIDCNFEDLGRGVTLWANNGVLFQNSKFDNCGVEAILAYDSEIEVIDSCKFFNNLNAIELFSTYPNPFGHRIGSLSTSKNVFNNNHYGIYGNNQSSIKGMKVENNRFENNDFGIFLAGLSHFTINSNHFEDLAMAQEIVATGPYENLITNNYMEDNSIPTSYVYKNEGSSFLRNCYVGNSYYDVLLNHSRVFPIIGSSSLSAGNCFTKNLVPSIYCNNNETSVKYYSYGNSTSCYYPGTSNCSNVTSLTATNNISMDCSPNINPITSSPHECDIPSTVGDILTSIFNYDGLINSTQSSTSFTSLEKQELIAGYKKCQSTLMFKFVEIGLNNPTIDFYVMVDSLVEFLDSKPEFNYKMNAYGLLVYSKQYTNAAGYLNGLTATNEEEDDFKTVQNINLDYLQNFAVYTPSRGILDTLFNIGMKTHPYTGYARSLFHLLTDELIQLDIPSIDGVILPRTPRSSENKLEIISYPNPLQEDTYNIKFTGGNDLGVVSIEIYDFFGKLIAHEKSEIKGDEIIQLSTNNWFPNIYVLSVKNFRGELLYSNRITKFK